MVQGTAGAGIEAAPVAYPKEPAANRTKKRLGFAQAQRPQAHGQIMEIDVGHGCGWLHLSAPIALFFVLDQTLYIQLNQGTIEIELRSQAFSPAWEQLLTPTSRPTCSDTPA